MEKKWTMPLWMEKWIPMIDNGMKYPTKQYIEDAMNEEEDYTTPYQDRTRGKVELLETLHEKGII